MLAFKGSRVIDTTRMSDDAGAVANFLHIPFDPLSLVGDNQTALAAGIPCGDAGVTGVFASFQRLNNTEGEHEPAGRISKPRNDT